MKAKVSLAFIQETPEAKVKFGNDVINGLETYPDVFSNTPVKVPDLTKQNDSLGKGITDAATGLTVARKALPKLVKNWNEAFRNDAVYVDGLANGDETIIAQSGYKSTRTEPVHTTKPGAADKFKIVPENEPGSFGIESHVSGASAYLFMALPEGVTVQQDHDMIVITVAGKKLYFMTDTHSDVHFSNIESGVPLNVSVLGFNLAGNGPISNSLPVIPQ